MKRILSLVAGMCLGTANAQPQPVWPPLPASGFIKGRAAAQSDIDAGNAAFVPAVGGVSIGEPLNIDIPQYAYFNGEGKTVPVILIQAERAQGTDILAGRLPSGETVVGTAGDFQLLGKKVPR